MRNDINHRETKFRLALPVSFCRSRLLRRNPGARIFVPGKAGGLRPTYDGSYHLATREEYNAARRAFGPQFWPDDVPENVPSPKCDTCQWTSRSYAAMMTHVNQAHGKPQR